MKVEGGIDLPPSEASVTIKGVSRDVMDPSEDSGFDSISVGSNSSSGKYRHLYENFIFRGNKGALLPLRGDHFSSVAMNVYIDVILRGFEEYFDS